ncbi:hypothetical protein SAY86_031009 [Trapa natans]|uniref:Bifunctional inhibitor/plant lipid transfer protein/seed storage helical domain-containing protein n=1 Tax=Trapa natans TaxID=22666 RepID=A0AAN7RH87_TRANT|nr:hypothetical protein SAY86_030552 [Trapa natans]KAK4798683.1 hypothetical protein SAY86_031009 [Trapa natans]
MKASPVMWVVCFAVAVAAAPPPPPPPQPCCDLQQLAPCLPPLMDPRLIPTPECCRGLISQQGCFCKIISNPPVDQYITNYIPGIRGIFLCCRVIPCF